jgi:hypothetical protein
VNFAGVGWQRRDRPSQETEGAQVRLTGRAQSCAGSQLMDVAPPRRGRVDWLVRSDSHFLARGRRPEGAGVLIMRPNQGIGVLVRCNRSDSRDTDHRPCSRPPDDLIGRCH